MPFLLNLERIFNPNSISLSETETYVSSSDAEPELKRQRLEFATTENGHTYSMVMSSDDTSAVAAMQAINHSLGDISHQISDVTTSHITIPVTITTDSQIQVGKAYIFEQACQRHVALLFLVLTISIKQPVSIG